MNKRISALLLSVVTILSVVSIFAISAYAKADYNDEVGYYETYTKTIGALNKNTEIAHLQKSFPNTTYSQIRLRTKSTVNKMNVWVMTGNETWMSEKYKAYPTGNICTIYYYTDQTFRKGANVYLWGEQGNVREKSAHLTFYAY